MLQFFSLISDGLGSMHIDHDTMLLSSVKLSYILVVIYCAAYGAERLFILVVFTSDAPVVFC